MTPALFEDVYDNRTESGSTEFSKEAVYRVASLNKHWSRYGSDGEGASDEEFEKMRMQALASLDKLRVLW